ncbi:phospholipase D family protein [Vreelandella profundi]|uniref:phospholipase D family protein n=1 Tax=Vreelandella profundi TaxID=2852117 RepID=UPI001EEFDB7E|nr:phospholipase D family protein [Halomonas profundi]
MIFFGNKVNGNYLRDVLPSKNSDVESVKAAIAYGSDASTLLANCLANKFRLDIWMRYDHTVPVSPNLLRKLLTNVGNNIFCNLVPDILHSKVVWWKGYGAYIGSANLTDRAWVTNIEFGVFLSEEELLVDNSLAQIELFFENLASYEEIFPLSEEVITEQEKLYKLRQSQMKAIDEASLKQRKHKVWEGPATHTTPEKAYDAHRSRFIKEWGDGISYLRNIASKAPAYRPAWLNEGVPAEWQADQFLHAYYHNEVKDGAKHPYEDFYSKNKADPAKALEAGLQWWSRLPGPPSNEDDNCHRRAPVIYELLSKENIGNLTVEGFAEICKANHSTADHVKRMRLAVLCIDDAHTGLDGRVEAFAEWLWAKKNNSGQTIKDLLIYVMDSGRPEDFVDMLFEAAYSENRKFPHFGINQISEMTGWARPELCPPRNGRTSKGLRALGYDVKIH